MPTTTKAILLIIGVGMLCTPGEVSSQIRNNSLYDTINQDDLGNVSDKFQDLFFQALTQSAIENHEKAIDLLKKARDISPDKAVVYFELGKNNLALKNYQSAEHYFRKALAEKPNDRTVRKALYKVYDESKNYHKAIEVAKTLAQKEVNYQEDLAQLYLLDKQYLKALKALDKLDTRQGRNEFRRALRRKIFRQTDNTDAAITYLKQQIKAAPDNTDNYIDLILLYNRLGHQKDAFDTAQNLLGKNPETEDAKLGLYGYYLEQGENDKAVQAMKALLKDEDLDKDIKKHIIKQFSKLVKTHPKYEDDLVWVLGEESSAGHQSNQQLGEYYLGKDNTKALFYFEKALHETPANFKLIKETLTLQVKEKHYEAARNRAKKSLTIFPSQPLLYLMQGTAENGLKNYTAAKEALQNGLDFVADNTALKIRFYRELSKALRGLGDSQKALNFQKKADQLNAQK